MTIREETGCDGFICWCIVCRYRIVRRGREDGGSINACFKDEKFIGYGHKECVEAFGGTDEKK